ncbi:hypothetical protein BUE80_DR005339 [Diplocarpon rosae]|nr:hypothetical protein BUE80_DR005339 [Diplocarpon rosae]
MWLKRFRGVFKFRSEAATLRRRKAKEESASIRFLAASVKSCPKCKAKVELYAGCDHVTCQYSRVPAIALRRLAEYSPGICSHQFCWVCLRPWGLRFHDSACRYFRPDLVHSLKMDNPVNEGLWLDAHNMVMINGVGIRELYTAYEDNPHAFF